MADRRILVLEEMLDRHEPQSQFDESGCFRVLLFLAHLLYHESLLAHKQMLE